jgi:cytochrome P450
MTTTTPETDGYGLLDPAVRADPYPAYARLRREAPAYFSEAHDAWLLTRHDDVLAGFRDPRLSANRAGSYAQRLPPAALEAVRPLVQNLASWALLLDPPDHTRIRALLNKAFTPRLIDGLAPRIEALVEGLLDGVGATGKGGMDLIADLATPLPVIVIGDMLGVPREDAPRLKAWSDGIAAFMGARPSMDVAARSVRSIVEMEEYFRAAIVARRRAPTGDLLSSLLAAEEQGAILSEQELLSTCVMVLFGGHETTTNLIGNSVLALLAHPAELDALRSSPSIPEGAVEELLRYDSPVQRMGRVVLEDLEIRGATLRKGDRVFLMLGAANRDPAVFADPDRLDLRRARGRHLSFGMGAHYCVGAALGRLEAELALGALVRRFPRLARAGGELTWLDNATVRGVTSLPVVLV